jgi:multidrug efflux pump
MHIKDELSRLPGISEVLLFGQRDYSMRIWVDPDKLATLNLSIGDVVAALREENRDIAAGHIGQAPAPPDELGGAAALELPLDVLGRLSTVEEFEQVVLRADHEGNLLCIKDIGRVELGARSQDIANRFDGKPTVGLAIFQLPDANALKTADAIKATMAELSQDFPQGVHYEIGYDTTPFIRESIFEVVKSLRDAIILVAIVVLVFLQGWRAALIPLIAVPVAIIGTFAAMALTGFSINNLTLFGLVLAIGIVVDDAIVVVEAVEQYIERGLAPRDAAIAAMQEVSGPVIAVGLVLSAVFIPCAFLSGIVGLFFRQFALTIAISTAISTLNSLTLSPALAALLLKPKSAARDPLTRVIDFLFGWFFWLFNATFRVSTRAYISIVGRMLRVPSLVLIVYGGLLYLTYWGFQQLPSGFIPSQDKGYFLAGIQLPDSSSAMRTREVVARIEQIALSIPGIKNVNSVAGNAFVLSAYGSNFGTMFIILEQFDDRREPEKSAANILKQLNRRIAAEIPEALINVFPPPAVNGLGRAGGFKLMIEDRGEAGLLALQKETDNIVRQANKEAAPVGMFTVFNANSPQLFVDINREECLTQGINLNDVFGTLQGYLGSRYVNNFNRFGRTWQVVVQADERFRDEVRDVGKLRVRNRLGEMVPIASIASLREISSPLVLTRYNMYPSAAINGSLKPGFSSGQAREQVEAVCRRELPETMSMEWTEITFLEQLVKNTGIQLFGLSVLFVFLVLAALYESWSLPLAVILVVPMCVLSSITGVAIAKMDINLFTQIGFIVLIGLACKNAILIVEFAKFRRAAGDSRREATLHACELRLRPILMTSFAFILGVVPLVMAKGAGAEMRQALGTAVFSGMLGVTLFGIFLTPVFFAVIDQMTEWKILSGGWVGFVGKFLMDLLTLAPIRHGIVRLLTPSRGK